MKIWLNAMQTDAIACKKKAIPEFRWFSHSVFGSCENVSSSRMLHLMGWGSGSRILHLCCAFLDDSGSNSLITQSELMNTKFTWYVLPWTGR